MTAEELLAYMRQEAYKPLTVKELEEVFGIQDVADFKEFVRLIQELEETGQIVRTRSNRFGVPERMNLLRGRLQTHPKGYGFVIPTEPGMDDVYVHHSDMNGALNGDLILIRVHKRRDDGRLEGEVVRILERGLRTVVGTYRDERYYGYVLPDDKRITLPVLIPQGAHGQAMEGQKVVARITKFPEGRGTALEGEITEVLGYQDEPGVDILSIIRRFELPEIFPEEVLQEAEQLPDTISEEEMAGRRDLRGETIVTIDGEDAKDLDDAISVTRLEDGRWKLGVHISDVSYYVKEGSPLDREAYRRGNSVYLVDRVIPMLPPRLSNGICSLHPHVDRLTMSCEMVINARGMVESYEIFPSVIRTTERMTYQNVYRLLEQREEYPELAERYRELIPLFEEMKQLAATLRNRRMERGAVDFDFDEARIVVDSDGKPIEIYKQERTIAEQIIEEFMLIANETVARHMFELGLPFLYRIHEKPNAENMIDFATFISTLGYRLRGSTHNIHPKALQSVLEAVKGNPEEHIISTVMLRSMKQARYESENLGHFGLAAEYYTHFTAPIRRYPDLVVHRLLREHLSQGYFTPQRIDHYNQILPDIADHTSIRERVAVDAERETEELKKAEYMLQHLGEEFDGIISGVTAFGLFVQLENTVEGLVHVSYLTDDYYHYHEKQYALIGERTGRQFRLGDQVRVRVSKVSVEERAIDFEMVGMKAPSRRTERPKLIAVPDVEKKRKGERPGKRRRTAAMASRSNGGKRTKNRGKR